MMENLVQVAGVVFLVIAWLVGIGYLRRHWPSMHDEIRNAGRALGDAIGRLFPDLPIEIGTVRRRLRNEISRVFPLFSAETTEGREAEFIRDQLPERFPFWVAVLAIIAIGGLAWWVTR